jgi:hypothetical protein
MIRNWTSRKHEEHWKYKDRLRAFLKNPLEKKLVSAQPEQKPA